MASFRRRAPLPPTTAHRGEDPSFDDSLAAIGASFERDPATADPTAIAPYFGVEGPFSSQINRLLSASFGGASLAHLSLTRNADTANAALGADASTAGTHIALSSTIREDPTDAYSMGIISHEVAHALAGGGSGDTFVDGANDPGEHIAYAAGDAMTSFVASGMRGPAPQLAPAHGGQASIHRHSIQPDLPGLSLTRDPVHEIMTVESLKAAGLLPQGATIDDDSAKEYIRGVRWNDDPQVQMFHEKSFPESLGTGGLYGAFRGPIDFLMDFMSDEKAAGKGAEFGPGSPLLGRTHFGDLSALHGMAEKEGEDPAITKQRMMMWAELTTKVAGGQFQGKQHLGELAMKNPQFAAMFKNDPTLKDKSIDELFGNTDGKGDIRKRASGSLLHLIQDSYAEGHTQRARNADGSFGAIEEFHAYPHQDHDKHSGKDQLPKGGDGNAVAQTYDKPGGQTAMIEGATVMRLIAEGRPPEEVLAYLDKNTFKTAAGIHPATGGEDFKPSEKRSDPRARGAARAAGDR